MKLRHFLHLHKLSKKEFRQTVKITKNNLDKALECRADPETAEKISIATRGVVAARDCVTRERTRQPSECGTDIVIPAFLWQRSEISTDALIVYARSAHCRGIDAVNDLGWTPERYEIALAELRSCKVRLRRRKEKL